MPNPLRFINPLHLVLETAAYLLLRFLVELPLLIRGQDRTGTVATGARRPNVVMFRTATKEQTTFMSYVLIALVASRVAVMFRALKVNFTVREHMCADNSAD